MNDKTLSNRPCSQNRSKPVKTQNANNTYEMKKCNDMKPYHFHMWFNYNFIDSSHLKHWKNKKLNWVVLLIITSIVGDGKSFIAEILEFSPSPLKSKWTLLITMLCGMKDKYCLIPWLIWQVLLMNGQRLWCNSYDRSPNLESRRNSSQNSSWT